MNTMPAFARRPSAESESETTTDSGAADTARDVAVAELYEEHWVGMVRLALLMLGDRPSAEDVAQDAFTELHRRWHRLRDPSSAVAYVRSAVLNRSRSVLRRRKVASRFAQHEPPVWSAEQNAIVEESRREVLRALDRLPTRRREVLVLRFYLDLGDAEIAATLGIREGTVRSAASRGLATLGRLLEDSR